MLLFLLHHICLGVCKSREWVKFSAQHRRPLVLLKRFLKKWVVTSLFLVACFPKTGNVTFRNIARLLPRFYTIVFTKRQSKRLAVITFASPLLHTRALNLYSTFNSYCVKLRDYLPLMKLDICTLWRSQEPRNRRRKQCFCFKTSGARFIHIRKVRSACKSPPRTKLKRIQTKKCTMCFWWSRGGKYPFYGVFLSFFAVEDQCVKFQIPETSEHRVTCRHSRLTTSYQISSEYIKREGYSNLKSEKFTKFWQKVEKLFERFDMFGCIFRVFQSCTPKSTIASSFGVKNKKLQFFKLKNAFITTNFSPQNCDKCFLALVVL